MSVMTKGSKREDRHTAQDRIMNAISNAALRADEGEEPEIAEAIRQQGAVIAKRFGLHDVPGFPLTYASRG